MDQPNDDDGMDSLAEESVAAVDAALAATEAALLLRTDPQIILALKPKVSNPQDIDRIIMVVNQCTKGNINAAELKSKIESLGSGVMATAKTVCSLLKKV